MKEYRGRLAPTPSGFLHMGHLRTFRRAMERAKEGVLVFRLEDLDSSRCLEVYKKAAVDDLLMSGLSWDEGGGKGGDFGPYEQSARGDFYRRAMAILAAKGLVYPCGASRSKIAGFPRAPDGEPMFPRILRPDFAGNSKKILKIFGSENWTGFNWRFMVREGERINFTDGNFGDQSFEAGADFSDFLVWRKDGIPSYELAVVCDDAAMKITEVVRGADLLKSTARQILLYRALEEKIPDFFHCELLLGDDGSKISKSGMGNANPMLIRNCLKLF